MCALTGLSVTNSFLKFGLSEKSPRWQYRKGWRSVAEVISFSSALISHNNSNVVAENVMFCFNQFQLARATIPSCATVSHFALLVLKLSPVLFKTNVICFNFIQLILRRQPLFYCLRCEDQYRTNYHLVFKFVTICRSATPYKKWLLIRST